MSTQESSDSTWEALPPRKNRRRRRQGDEFDDEEEHSSTVSHMTTAQLAASRIAENIAARAMVNRSQTTLESLDGCAREFYECE